MSFFISYQSFKTSKILHFLVDLSVIDSSWPHMLYFMFCPFSWMDRLAYQVCYRLFGLSTCSFVVRWKLNLKKPELPAGSLTLRMCSFHLRGDKGCNWELVLALMDYQKNQKGTQEIRNLRKDPRRSSLMQRILRWADFEPNISFMLPMSEIALDGTWKRACPVLREVNGFFFFSFFKTIRYLAGYMSIHA